MLFTCTSMSQGEQVCELCCCSDGHGRVLLHHVTDTICCLPVFLCPKVNRCVNCTLTLMGSEQYRRFTSIIGFSVYLCFHVPPGEQECELHCHIDGQRTGLPCHVSHRIFCLPTFSCPPGEECRLHCRTDGQRTALLCHVSHRIFCLPMFSRSSGEQECELHCRIDGQRTVLLRHINGKSWYQDGTVCASVSGSFGRCIDGKCRVGSMPFFSLFHVSIHSFSWMLLMLFMIIF